MTQRSENTGRFAEAIGRMQSPAQEQFALLDLSMRNLDIDRAGNRLKKKQKGTLQEAKDELHKDFGRKAGHGH